MTLGDLSPGEQGIVKDILGEGVLRRRLLDMGLTPGVSVHLVKRAPAGDPLEIALRGYALSLRAQEARQVVLRERVQ